MCLHVIMMNGIQVRETNTGVIYYLLCKNEYADNKPRKLGARQTPINIIGIEIDAANGIHEKENNMKILNNFSNHAIHCYVIAMIKILNPLTGNITNGDDIDNDIFST